MMSVMDDINQEYVDTEISKEVMSKIDNWMNDYVGGEVNDGYKGVIIGALNHYLGGGRARRILLGYMFPTEGEDIQEKSTKDLTDEQWFALFRWVSPWKEETENVWCYDADFTRDIGAVYACAKVEWDRTYAPVVDDPLFENGEPSEMTRYLLEQGGTITKVLEEVEERRSLLSGTGASRILQERRTENE